MKLKDITYDGVVQGIIRDLEQEIDYEIFTKRMRNGVGLPKHHTSLKRGNKTLGYIYYISDGNQELSSFIGLEVIAGYRGEGLSNAILETYFVISQDNEILNFQTKSQRKPFTTFILMKYGYIPNNQSPNRRAHILKPGISYPDKLRIAFNNPKYQERFMGSRLYKSRQYDVVELNDEEILSSVQLRSGYKLANFELLNQRRVRNKERFEIRL